MNKQIEEDFAMLTRLLLGKSLGQLKEYEGWLAEAPFPGVTRWKENLVKIVRPQPRHDLL